MNPLLETWTTPFGLPPFARLDEAHFLPAFEAAMAEGQANAERIASSSAVPTFANTIEALERATRTLARVAAVFSNLASAHTTAGIEALQRTVSPRLAAFHAGLNQDPRLYARIERLYQARAELGLTPEQLRVLELYRRQFVRAGAALPPPERARLAAIMERLATLGTAFAQNVLHDERTWTLPLGDGDRAGLPQWLIAAATEAGQARGLAQPVITLSRSLIVPFLECSTRRDLREIAFRAWTRRGANGGAQDNRAIIREILELRAERARLLGYPDFATFKLEPEMAGTPQAVRDLLMAVWRPALAAAEADARILGELLGRDGCNDVLRPWDWRFYAARRQEAEFGLDSAEVKPYFALDAMIAAAFDAAGRLFGLAFEPIEAELHHPDARAWNVTRGGRHMGVFIGDYFARPSKRSGAWCSTFRTQRKLDGEVRPLVLNVCNFAKAPAGEPCLLTSDDARTLFHEFGHALHQLLSDVTYEFVSGTSVARDFVELPSQLYEHWLEVPELRARHARHVETGAPMPRELAERLVAARNHDMGFRTVEYVASALVDLDLHSGPPQPDPAAAEAATLAALGMPAAIAMRHATPHFLHVFTGDGYSAGYYSYMWSEVLDADAFAAFEEAGDPFDQATAERLHRYIYSAGGSGDAAALYTAFRGRMPGVEALLTQRGLASA
ncbi:MAG: M3 family metallopeptidase [Pseudomonadales bacterium]|nr:M3 family metallopeptidase [Pseudomonadales bacterium]